MVVIPVVKEMVEEEVAFCDWMSAYPPDNPKPRVEALDVKATFVPAVGVT